MEGHAPGRRVGPGDLQGPRQCTGGAVVLPQVPPHEHVDDIIPVRLDDQMVHSLLQKVAQLARVGRAGLLQRGHIQQQHLALCRLGPDIQRSYQADVALLEGRGLVVDDGDATSRSG